METIGAKVPVIVENPYYKPKPAPAQSMAESEPVWYFEGQHIDEGMFQSLSICPTDTKGCHQIKNRSQKFKNV